ncbi:hypothetical protein C8Q76DRAFT_636225 [Earliella scabrosa]|nr:hypothetical protein C8Q76DRAFT_636225 [Earliella scabrosa]
MASQLLSQSLSALPDPSTALGVGKDVKGKARAASSTYPASQASGAPESADGGEEEEKKPAAPPAPRAHNTRLATGALSTPPNAYKERSLRSAAATANGSADKGKGKEKAGDGGGEVGDAGGSPAVGALAVLKDCRIFVDVRTDEGDDAGALFVDMLRGMGAKIANRVGSRCTHVVFKNGLMSTLNRYRLLGDHKPFVVGIRWVVECVEQRKRVDESGFKVNLELANVAGVNKVRNPLLCHGTDSHAVRVETQVDDAKAHIARGEQDRDVACLL